MGLVLLAAAPGAEAQMFDSIGKGGKAEAPPPKVEPPPALPGAQSNNSGGAAPATKAPTDMEPNDALFDAINRGDLAAVRDAISRGADLSAQNILGMTPLELSVDLGRNDISFVLLSMRGGDSSRPPQPVTKVSAKPGPVKQAKETSARAPKAAKAAGPAPTQTPRLFAGDGGTPNPNAGFLGFDSGHR